MDEVFSPSLEIMAMVRDIQEANRKLSETTRGYASLLFRFEEEEFAYSRTWGDELDQHLKLEMPGSGTPPKSVERRADSIEYVLLEKMGILSHSLEQSDRGEARYIQNAFATMLSERCWQVTNSDPAMCLNLPWEKTAFEARWISIPERLIEHLLAACDCRVKVSLGLTVADRNDSRDEWIYHEILKGTKDPEIMMQFDKLADAHGWGQITKRQGFTLAAKRYAVRNNLPCPSPRKQGRTS